MNLSLKTGFGSVCSVVPRIRWTSCRWIEPGTGAFPIMRFTRRMQRFTFWEDEDASRAYLFAGMGRSYEHFTTAANIP